MSKRNFALTILCVILYIGKSLCQPVIDWTVSPVVGDVDSGVVTDTLNWDPGPAGADVTWDFTALTNVRSGRVAWAAPSSTPYASSFADANLSINQGGFYSYYKSETGGYYTLGNASNAGPKIVYAKKQTVVTYPFTYKDSLYDTTTGTYEQTTVSAGYTIVSTGHRTMYSKTVADGYGTLKVPGNVFPNSLRLKMTSTTIDSITMSINGGTGSKSVAIADYTQYYWVTAETRLWAMYMSNTFMHNSGHYIKSAMITYAKGRASTSLLPSRQAVNPNARVTIQQRGISILVPKAFTRMPCLFELFDLQGNYFLRSEIKSESVSLSRSAIPAGIYCWRIVNGSRVLGINKILIR